MGLPVAKLICASNENDVLTEFIDTGVYNRNRDFYTTISPSMDILVSSNLERLLFELSGKNDKLIGNYMRDLFESGRYSVTSSIMEDLKNDFSSGSCTDEETKRQIRETFAGSSYLIDTHTAVAYRVLERYRDETGDRRLSVVVSTASPFKFCDSVLDALGDRSGVTGISLIDRLEEVTGKQAPRPLKALRSKRERFHTCVEKKNMRAAVRDFLLSDGRLGRTDK
jgi:threonine synthase